MDTILPSPKSRAGEVTQAVARLFADKPVWYVDEIIMNLQHFNRKEIHNSLGYLARRKILVRIAYGKYAHLRLRG